MYNCLKIFGIYKCKKKHAPQKNRKYSKHHPLVRELQHIHHINK